MNETNANLILCDFAQVTDGKLTIVGGGWNEIHVLGHPFSVAALIEVPWSAQGRRHEVLLELLDEDGYPVMNDELGVPVRVEALLEINEGDTTPERMGVSVNVPFACMFPPLPLKAGRRYVWQLSVDGTSNTGWRAAFLVNRDA
jgi:hypothetical protein